MAESRIETTTHESGRVSYRVSCDWESPRSRRDRFVCEYGLTTAQAEILVDSRQLADYFEATVEAMRNG